MTITLLIHKQQQQETTMKKLAIYIRISTTDQNLASQKAEIQKWLDGNANGRDVVWFEDKATGNNLNRPGFKKLEKAIFNGEVDTVVIYKLDRLSRQLREGLNILCDWCDKGLRIVSVTQQIDFNGSVGKMMAAMILGIAEMEQQTRKERQSAGIAVAKKEGKYKGRKSGTTKAKPADIAALEKRGFSKSEIAKQLGIGVSSVYRLAKAN
jgi:DNA invertase Pin-like site-specific DNA recombinase